MVDEEQQKKMEELLDRLEKFNKDRGLYNISSIILSILDVISGIICAFYVSVQVSAAVVSLITGILITSRTVQVIKIEKLSKTLGLFLKKSWVRRVFSVCLLFITTRIKRGNNKMAKWLKANKFSVLMGIIACGVVAGAVWFVISSYWSASPLWAHILITAGSGLVSCLGVYFLGAEKWTEYVLRISAKKLSKENQAKLSETATALFNQAKALEEQSKKEAELKAQAEAQAKAELEAKQKAELEQLTQAKLQEIKNIQA